MEFSAEKNLKLGHVLTLGSLLLANSNDVGAFRGERALEGDMVSPLQPTFGENDSVGCELLKFPFGFDCHVTTDATDGPRLKTIESTEAGSDQNGFHQQQHEANLVRSFTSPGTFTELSRGTNTKAVRGGGGEEAFPVTNRPRAVEIA